jgi:hypothetical protein
MYNSHPVMYISIVDRMLLILHHSYLIVLAAGWTGRGKPHINEPITAEAALTFLTHQNITTETRKMS